MRGLAGQRLWFECQSSSFGPSSQRSSERSAVWRASIAHRRRALGLVRAVTCRNRSLQAELLAELLAELQVRPRWELRGVGEYVVRAVLVRDRVRARPGAARRNLSRPIASIAGVDIVEHLNSTKSLPAPRPTETLPRTETP